MARPRLVLVHGVGLDHTMWDTVADRLVTTFDVATPDLLGHGGREAAPVGVTLKDMADDLVQQLEPGTHLVGFSLGALVGQHVARFRPDLVTSLTSASSVCQRTDDERAAVEIRLSAAEASFEESVRVALHRWFHDTAVDPLAVQATESTLLANDPTSYVNCYRVFARGDADIAAELSRISVPSLAITGELDPGSTPQMTRRLAREIPDCRAVVVPGARHLLPVQSPQPFADALVSFIGGLS